LAAIASQGKLAFDNLVAAPAFHAQASHFKAQARQKGKHSELLDVLGVGDSGHGLLVNWFVNIGLCVAGQDFRPVFGKPECLAAVAHSGKWNALGVTLPP
jgi:hypothetical protein